MKQCCICKEFKELAEFQKDSSHKDGLDNSCKICTNIYKRSKSKEYYNKNKELFRKRARDWQRNHKESRKEYRELHKERSSETSRAWAKAHPQRRYENGRKCELKLKYNLTIEDYDNIYKKQEGKCAICGKHQDTLEQALHVDHDHKTGRIRGLLCKNCNLILGNAFDSIEILLKATRYLNELPASE